MPHPLWVRGGHVHGVYNDWRFPGAIEAGLGQWCPSLRAGMKAEYSGGESR